MPPVVQIEPPRLAQWIERFTYAARIMQDDAQSHVAKRVLRVDFYRSTHVHLGIVELGQRRLGEHFQRFAGAVGQQVEMDAVGDCGLSEGVWIAQG